MPANAGLKLRPHFGLTRTISSQRVSMGRLAGLLPRAVFLPLVAVAFMTAAAAVFWTSSMDDGEHVAVIEVPVTTGSVNKAN